MQVNAQAIVDAATATGKFELVKDRLFVENLLYPAFAVGRRFAPMKPLDEGKILYRSDWRYEVFVVVRAEGDPGDPDGEPPVPAELDDFDGLETCETALMKELAKRGFTILARQHTEMMISELDVIVSTIEVSRPRPEEFK